VLDEPTSALDVTVQAGIFDVLVELQAKLGLTYVLVSHDLALVRQLADTVTVLRAGEIVEQGAADRVLHAPEHDYTQLLIDSIPAPLASDAQPTARKASA
jgi:peptide/nickel transport system ATP-binding protein